MLIHGPHGPIKISRLIMFDWRLKGVINLLYLVGDDGSP